MTERHSKADAGPPATTAESKRELDHEALERLFIDSPAPIQILDATGKVRRENDAQVAFDAAFTEGELSGSGEGDRVANRELHAQMLTRALSGEVVDYEFAVRRSSSSPHVDWFERVLAPVRANDGALVSVVSVTLDVTERHRADEEKERLRADLLHAQKLESMGLLAGGMAHDVNNLLVAVLGNASLLMRQLPAESLLRKYVHGIEEAARRAADVANQMLAYSGKGRFSSEEVDLATLIRDTTELLRVSVSSKVVLAYEFDPQVPVLRGDATKVRQVVMNLLINASESMGEKPGKVVLRTGMSRVDQPTTERFVGGGSVPAGTYAFLEVEDDGCGMPEATLSRMFDPFYTTKVSGRGLGLAVVFGVVRAHHGALSVTTREGVGTTFRVLLPLESHIEVSSAPEGTMNSPRGGLSSNTAGSRSDGIEGAT